MDAFSLHPYEDNSSIPPSFTHPHTTTISLADYPKLVAPARRSLRRDGAAPAPRLPIVYDEFGVQSRIPAAKAAEYAGCEPRADRPVAEATQALYYAEALALAACQPTVHSLLIFHVSDEPDLDRWQSGLYYADDTPKTSLPRVQRGIDLLARSGSPRVHGDGRAGVHEACDRRLARPRTASRCGCRPAGRRPPRSPRPAGSRSPRGDGATTRRTRSSDPARGRTVEADPHAERPEIT